MTVPSNTPKRFCCSKCRQDWHSNQRKLGLALQDILESNDPKRDEVLYDQISRLSGVERDKVKLVIHALSRYQPSN